MAPYGALGHYYLISRVWNLSVDVMQKKGKSERPATFAQPKPKINQKPVEKSVAEPPKKKQFRITRKKIVVSTIILLVVVFAWINMSPEEKPDPVINGPDYTTILPEGESVVTLGGWKRVSPPENDPVYAYSDKIGDVPITVSQQPIPVKFGRNIESQVKKLAQGYNATDKIMADDTEVYIGTSSKGPQSVILAKEDLLILIKSQNKVSDSAWKEYVQSLTSANLPNIPKY